MAMLDGCTPVRCGTYPKFVSSENGCSHIGNNKDSNYVRQYQIDGQVVPSTSAAERCDYLLLNDTKQDAYYIELKGSDIHKAMRQVDNSVRMIQSSHPGYTIYRRIVYHSGSHDVNSSTVTRWKRTHGVKFVIIKSTRIEENI